jgi:hypothetical protein
MDVVVLNCCVTETNETLCWSKSSTSLAKSVRKHIRHAHEPRLLHEHKGQRVELEQDHWTQFNGRMPNSMIGIPHDEKLGPDKYPIEQTPCAQPERPSTEKQVSRLDVESIRNAIVIRRDKVRHKAFV